MKKQTQAKFLLSRTSVALWAGLLLACAGVVTPHPAAASPGNMCLVLAEGLHQDPLVSGHLPVTGVRKLTTRGERRFHGAPLGVAITVVPTAGMTTADLQRAAVCHAGNDHETSPLGVDGIKVQVVQRGSVYEVRITSESRSAALEVQRRAQQLAAR